MYGIPFIALPTGSTIVAGQTLPANLILPTPTLQSPTITGVASFAAGTSSNTSWNLAGDAASGPYRASANQLAWSFSTPTFRMLQAVIGMTSNGTYAWEGGSVNTLGSAFDTGVSRVSAGLVGVGTGAQGSVAGSLRAATYATSAPVTETNNTHTVAATTSHLICNNAGATTVTLPAAASFPGRILWIKAITANTVVSASSNVVPRAGGAAGTAIIGATDGGWAMLVSDGTTWENMAGTP